MRVLLFATLVSFVATSGGTAAAHECGAPTTRSKGRTGMFRGVYEPAKSPTHQPLYERLRKARALEQFSQALSALRLPKPLLIKFSSCGGMSNAWYEPSDGTVTFCYEYVAEIDHASAGATDHGIPAELASMGGVAFVLLHETAHALFDLLEVPVLGREEDAADHVAAFLLLTAGEGIARRVLTGAAWMYVHGAKARTPDESDFADVHGLDAQRFYNVLCMAYGGNPASFQGIVDKGYLPKDRAEGCREEFHQVAYAMSKLIDPSLDAELWARTKAANKRWADPQKPPRPAETKRK
jgi:Putative metallopeptidase